MSVKGTTSRSSVKLSLSEKLDLVFVLLSLPVTILQAVLTGLWRSQKNAKTFFLHVAYAVFRRLTRRLSPLQLQYAVPPSAAVYSQYVKSTGQVAQTVDIGAGTLAHWVGDKDAENVLVWFHGGGFSLPANIGYFKFYAQLGAHMKTAGKSLAVFSLSYTLAPHATYPTQQRQAVECVRYVLDKTGRDPANVYLGGDSAGGNLVCGVLSHISHPHPQINPLPLKGKLGGAVMIAPWTSMDTEFPPEIVIDSRGDIITEHVAGPWVGAYLGKAKRDYYTDLSAAPTEWFRDFRVKAVLVLAGGNEIMLPSLEDFITKFKAGFPSVEFFVGERECHIAPIYNLYLGDKTETEQGKRLKKWLRENV